MPRIEIELQNGLTQQVDFDSMPTDNDIDEVARHLSSIQPTIGQGFDKSKQPNTFDTVKDSLYEPENIGLQVQNPILPPQQPQSIAQPNQLQQPIQSQQPQQTFIPSKMTNNNLGQYSELQDGILDIGKPSNNVDFGTQNSLNGEYSQFQTPDDYKDWQPADATFNLSATKEHYLSDYNAPPLSEYINEIGTNEERLNRKFGNPNFYDNLDSDLSSSDDIVIDGNYIEDPEYIKQQQGFARQSAQFKQREQAYNLAEEERRKNSSLLQDHPYLYNIKDALRRGGHMFRGGAYNFLGKIGELSNNKNLTNWAYDKAIDANSRLNSIKNGQGKVNYVTGMFGENAPMMSGGLISAIGALGASNPISASLLVASNFIWNSLFTTNYFENRRALEEKFGRPLTKSESMQLIGTDTFEQCTNAVLESCGDFVTGKILSAGLQPTKNVMLNVAANIVSDTAGEGYTEWSQEGVSVASEQMLGLNNASSVENAQRQNEAAKGGAVMGGIMGGLGSVRSIIANRNSEQQSSSEPPQEPTRPVLPPLQQTTPNVTETPQNEAPASSNKTTSSVNGNVGTGTINFSKIKNAIDKIYEPVEYVDDIEPEGQNQPSSSSIKTQPTRQQANENAKRNGDVDTTLPPQAPIRSYIDTNDYNVTVLEPGMAEGANTLQRNTSGIENIYENVDNSSNQPDTLVNPKTYNKSLIRKLKQRYDVLEDPDTNRYILINKETGKQVSPDDILKLRDRLRRIYDSSSVHSIDKDANKFINAIFSDEDVFDNSVDDATEIMTPSRQIKEGLWVQEKPEYTTRYTDDMSPEFKQWYEKYSNSSPQKQRDMLNEKINSFDTLNDADDFVTQFSNVEYLDNMRLSAKNSKIGGNNVDIDDVSSTEKLTNAINENQDVLKNLKREKNEGDNYTNKNTIRWASDAWDLIYNGASGKTTTWTKVSLPDGTHNRAENTYDITKGLSPRFRGVVTNSNGNAQKPLQNFYNKTVNKILSNYSIPSNVKSVMLNQLDEAIDNYINNEWSQKPWNKDEKTPVISKFNGIRDAAGLKQEQEKQFIHLIESGRYSAAGRELVAKNIKYEYASDKAKKCIEEYFEQRLQSMNNILFIDGNGKPNFKKILKAAVKNRDFSMLKSFNRSKNSIRRPYNGDALSKEEKIKILDHAFERYQRMLNKNKSIIATDIKKDAYNSGQMKSKKQFNQNTGKYEDIGDSWDREHSGVLSSQDVENLIDKQISKYQKLIDDYKSNIDKVKTNIDLDNIANSYFDNTHDKAGNPNLNNEKIAQWATEGLNPKYGLHPDLIADFDKALASAKKNFAYEYQKRFLSGKDANIVNLEKRLKELDDEHTTFLNQRYINGDYSNQPVDEAIVSKNKKLSSSDAASKIVDCIKNNNIGNDHIGYKTTLGELYNHDNSIFHPITHDVIENIMDYGLETALRSSNGCTSIAERNIELDAHGGLNKSTVRHETGHIILDEISKNDNYVNKLLDDCYSANNNYFNYLDSIGCNTLLDVNINYGFGEKFDKALKLMLNYKLDTVEAWCEGISKSDKYIDIKDFERHFSDYKNDMLSLLANSPIEHLPDIFDIDKIIMDKAFDIFEKEGAIYNGQLKGTQTYNSKPYRNDEDNKTKSHSARYYHRGTVKGTRVSQEEVTKLHDDLTNAELDRTGSIRRTETENNIHVSEFNNSIKRTVGGIIKPEIARKLIPFIREGKGLPKSMPELQREFNKLSPAKREKLYKLSQKLYDGMSQPWKEYSDWNKISSTVDDSVYVPHSYIGATSKDQDLLNLYLSQQNDIKTSSRYGKHRANDSLAHVIDNGLLVKIDGKLKRINVKPELDYAKLMTKHSNDLSTAAANDKFIQKFADAKLSDGTKVSDTDTYNEYISRMLEKEPATNLYDNISAFAKNSEFAGSLFHHKALTESAASVNLKNTVEILNPVKMFNDLKSGKTDMVKKSELAKDASTHGVRFGALSDAQVEEIKSALSKLGIVGKAADTYFNANNKLLWEYLHNSYKLMAYESHCNWYKSKYKTDTVPKEIKQEIAQMANDLFGGQNWENLHISKSAVRTMQRLLKSPDWNVSATLREPMSVFSSEPLQRALNLFASKSEQGRKFREMCRKIGVASVNNNPKAASFRGKMGRRYARNYIALVGFAFPLFVGGFYRIKDFVENPDYYEDISDLNPNKRNRFSDGEESVLEDSLNALLPDTFAGRNKKGVELYARSGKQGRELPELFENGRYSLANKIASKSNPLISPLLQEGSVALANGSNDLHIKHKYGWQNGADQEKNLAKRTAKNYVKQFTPFAYKPNKDANVFSNIATSVKDLPRDSFIGKPSTKDTNFYSAVNEAKAKIIRGELNDNNTDFTRRIKSNNLHSFDKKVIGQGVLKKAAEDLIREHQDNPDNIRKIENQLLQYGLSNWDIKRIKKYASMSEEEASKLKKSYQKKYYSK